MTDAVLSANKRLFSLKKFDIIVATGFKEVHLSPLAENSKAAASASFRLLQIDLAYPDWPTRTPLTSTWSPTTP
ncbi:hypothetical protein [Lactobacillus delbrueckii]|uniref:Uncharacterized protein n=1 Tax=Lactobacillus delbrueckii subsp. bulgaricus (strain ATCC 11842 / DSM 20081 / BCRC 10696 / JCM 1002 / NBRC 13953 / NCIMB 11778 / NCTC 12712 / WDCM 00102 / Lb 14) TaxID=390333 RepID=Q1G9A1_LACDA|nr:hypothetical protein [Lactobacillus delbrueckii]ALT47862.1 hypothetical protein AT236_01476 [Lactobacillus delbrueckii subsp. bulgaricus]APV47661.1 hypothetical protein LB080_06740 [Lactobacillus delbrueckii subsp. bulgaricus]MBS4915456.1 hypothetical protein [Lactobacillus delbrueckii]MBT8926425.1 hypothetical protein [Lactobacillus delbrueckii subsp. bulgaricus]MBT8938758.1 hypothetical protein [Lactobacillus delbrueckii subsp. bulgaricus]